MGGGFAKPRQMMGGISSTLQNSFFNSFWSDHLQRKYSTAQFNIFISRVVSENTGIVGL